MKEYTSKTIRKKVGCGNAYLVFSELNGKFNRLFIYGDNTREAPCGEVWFDLIARLITYTLRRKDDTFEEGILKQFSGGRCHMAVPNKDRICSCPDAIGKAVKQYLEL